MSHPLSPTLREVSRATGFDSPNRAADALDQLQAECEMLREALTELVACKDLKDQIEAYDMSLYSIADAERNNDRQSEYDRRKPLAWDAARAALAAHQEGK